MRTITHVLVSTVLLARPGHGNRVRNTTAILGGLVPDLSMVAMVGWAKIDRAPAYAIWSQWYFNPPWQTVVDYFHSIPVYAALVLVGCGIRRARPSLASPGLFLIVFGLAGLSHIALDMPVHHGDAHAHFMPFSEWRFASPLSYWNPAYHGRAVALFEELLDIGLCILLAFRFKTIWARLVLALVLLSFALPSLYFGML